ncbi:MAG: hypothetical protein HY706_06915 [Candidatus Hydrogenedentes bacterium]|nr:hypothetical protein [Candidatus Hydrogenedentota bacterium]
MVRIVTQSEPDPFWGELKASSPKMEIVELDSILDLLRTEYILELDLPESDWQAMLESGRLPQPGTAEVAAGDLAQRDSIILDGETFVVVGRLKREVSGLTRTYVLPRHSTHQPHFLSSAGAVHGWYDPQGSQRLKSDDVPIEKLQGTRIHTAARARPGRILAAIAALVLIAGSGSMTWLWTFRRFHQVVPMVFRPIFRELVERKRLAFSMHALLYGVFLLFMLLACSVPLVNYAAIRGVQGIFTEGPLQYVGAAYSTGNVLLAAAATFTVNFFMATVAYSIIPSFFIPCWGVIKNLLSFALVGFVMAPIWSGSLRHFTYHSITMVIELEAYIITSFFVTMLTVRFVRGIRDSSVKGAFTAEILQALRVVGSGTLLAAVILAVAALYEATTIILFALR